MKTVGTVLFWIAMIWVVLGLICAVITFIDISHDKSLDPRIEEMMKHPVLVALVFLIKGPIIIFVAIGNACRKRRGECS